MTDFVANLLGAVSLSVTDRMDAVMELEPGLEGQAAGALVLLGLRPDTSIKRLAERLRLSHSGTVRLTERLVRLGWVDRVRDTTDRRTVRLALTSSGQAQLDRIRSARMEVLKCLLGHLTEAERTSFEALLSSIMERLTTDIVAAFANCRLCDTPLCEAAGCPAEAAARRLVPTTAVAARTS